MATVLESLQGVNAYPVPLRTLDEIAERRGLNLTETATSVILTGDAYNLAVADVYMWLSLAPAISQGGQSYSFTDDQRAQFRNRAKCLYADFNESGSFEPIYGYKGSSL